VIPFGSERWRETIAFRDYVRAHPDVAREYAALKSRLADTFRLDREAYTQAKGPFMARIAALALAWRGPAA
jgi:GrpB-like predicted nucleotidyltransferase (UPF0157 family)